MQEKRTGFVCEERGYGSVIEKDRIHNSDDGLKACTRFSGKRQPPSSDVAAAGSLASEKVLCRSRDLNYTKHETARLCHSIAKPKHFTAVLGLYNGPKMSEKLEKRGHNP